ncbi:MAG: DUF5050 domain-containing protein [Clostridium sp.]
MISNTLSNICNNGLLAEYNKDIYFVNVYRGEDLYRVCGKMYTQISCDKVKNINIVNNRIYYITLLGELKSIDINGEDEKLLLNGPIDGAIVEGNKVFYINVLDNYSIYSYDIETREITKLIPNICDKLNLNNKYIGYIKCSDNLDWYGSGSICVIDREEDREIELPYLLTSNMVLDGDYIYFVAEEFNHQLNRINLLTGEIITITENTIGSFNIYGENIYFANISDEGKLYKVNLTSFNVEKISDDIPENINIAGDYIYFANAAYGYPYRLYRMKIDGSEKQMI